MYSDIIKYLVPALKSVCVCVCGNYGISESGEDPCKRIPGVMYKTLKLISSLLVSSVLWVYSSVKINYKRYVKLSGSGRDRMKDDVPFSSVNKEKGEERLYILVRMTPQELCLSTFSLCS